MKAVFPLLIAGVITCSCTGPDASSQPSAQKQPHVDDPTKPFSEKEYLEAIPSILHGGREQTRQAYLAEALRLCNEYLERFPRGAHRDVIKGHRWQILRSPEYKRRRYHEGDHWTPEEKRRMKELETQ